MKTQFASLPTLKNILLYMLVYLLWFVNTLVSAVAVIQLRSTTNVFWVALGGDRFTLSLVNQVCLLLGGFVAFVYVMTLESHYRESITRQVEKASPQHQTSLTQRLTDLGLGLLLRRFAVTTAIPLGVCIASLVALEIALHIMN